MVLHHHPLLKAEPLQKKAACLETKLPGGGGGLPEVVISLAGDAFLSLPPTPPTPPSPPNLVVIMHTSGRESLKSRPLRQPNVFPFRINSWLAGRPQVMPIPWRGPRVEAPPLCVTYLEGRAGQWWR